MKISHEITKITVNPNVGWATVNVFFTIDPIQELPAFKKMLQQFNNQDEQKTL